MTIAESLYQLQQVDQALQVKRRRLGEVETRLGESKELRNARARLEAIRERLASLERRQRKQELELQNLADKIESEEARLYGGRVQNPKELAGLQKEVHYLKQRRQDLEDALLEIMLAREEAQTQTRTEVATLDEIERIWRSEQAHLIDERDRLLQELATLDERRTELASQVSPDVLRTYDYLRRTKGQAVAPIEGGLCSGCRVALPSVERQQARASQALAYCGNCGRILVILA